MDLIKITPDKERVKSILNMVSLLQERIKLQDKTKMTALISVDYYEIIKELTTALLLLDGYKTLSHKDLFEYLTMHYPQFPESELAVIDDLRVLRNRISYEGFLIPLSYLQMNEPTFKGSIKKLKEIINKKLLKER